MIDLSEFCSFERKLIDLSQLDLRDLEHDYSGETTVHHIENWLNNQAPADAVYIIEGKLLQHTETTWRCNVCGRLHDLGHKTPEKAYMNCCSSCGAVFNMQAYLSMRRAIEQKTKLQ